jgi:aminoglycoside phosphotransferase (APT) family kinase protein
MQEAEVARAVAAARSIASALGLKVDDATVAHNSNKLTVRLAPCGVLARVAPLAHQNLQFEIELAGRLAEIGSPVAALAPGLEPRVHARDGFAVTLWTYYEPAPPSDISPADYAGALARLHAGLRALDVPSPHFTDRVAEAQHLVASCDLTPALGEADRALLAGALQELRQAVGRRAAPGQLLHGEPHPGNLLVTAGGPRFIDFETCCRGPVEFDLAHAPEAVGARYPGADQALLSDCRGLVLAMVAAWRWDRTDQFPDRESARGYLLRALRQGPPWPTLDTLMEASRRL